MASNETLTIKGITYNVVKSETPDDEYEAGRVNLARHMKRSNIVRYVYVQKPRGKAIYWVTEWTGGRFGKMTVLP
jgi:hypothetical protein